MAAPTGPRANPPLTELAGVGPARAARLSRAGLHGVRDLLLLVPRRLERSGLRCTVRAAIAAFAGAGEAGPGEVAVLGTLRGLRLFRAGRRRSVLALDLVDETGTLRALFFNQPWLFERLRALAAAGARVELAGSMGRSQQGPALLAPRLVETPPAERTPGFVPVYPSTEGIGQEFLRRIVRQALEQHGQALVEPLAAEQLARVDLPALPVAVAALHRPASEVEFERARRRLALEHLLVLQARLALARARTRERRARACVLGAGQRRELLGALPFVPTAGQRAVLDEILADLGRTAPMRRLLQGEVGAGKTLVALAACAAVASGGGQAALLVPTEILCEQHFLGLAPALERFRMRAVLLTGSLGRPALRAARAELRGGTAQLAIGTHALLSPEVAFARLDLVVIDEQQRFGVAEKQALLEKGADVHALLMTATPIPRTLALCFYGDLETSLLAERPPGRAAVTTRLVGEDGRAEMLTHLVERACAGERIFWVCPRIVAPAADDERGRAARGDAPEGESRAESSSAERVFERLAAGPLGAFGVELVHGRIPAQRRGLAVERFRSGASKVLVGTSIVEVGVDVPEATVMVIEGAERFGLAQLHQLRGRVGRSARPSWCFLLAGERADPRLEFLAGCADGFAIAEEDLRRRGMGDLAGLRQAGASLEGLDPELDLALVQFARACLQEDVGLLRHYSGAEAAALV